MYIETGMMVKVYKTSKSRIILFIANDLTVKGSRYRETRKHNYNDIEVKNLYANFSNLSNNERNTTNKDSMG